MKYLLISLALALVLALAAAPRVRAMQDDDLLDPALSTDTVKAEDAADEDDAQAEIQESDEDLAGFIQDYVRKDVALKGSFFLEDPASGRVLKLALASAPKRSSDGPDNSKVLEAVFNAAGGKKYTVLFHLRNAGFGGIDVFRIALKKEEKAKAGPKEKK